MLEAMLETAIKVELLVVSAPDPEALGARAEAMIAELGAISAEPDRLVRLFLTPEHRRAADLVAGWMRAAGLSVSEDALGTVRGRFGSATPRLLIGSHIDTVIDAGKYDGPLGVVAGILAAEHFARAKAELPFGIDVLAFGDEEGSRFPATLTSSSACAGVFENEALATADADGVTLAAALRAYGKDPDGYRRRRLPARRTPRATSRCISSRGRCWRRRASRSASSPASSARAGFASP